MSRSYSDASYATKQAVYTPSTGTLNGTAAAAATVTVHTFMEPANVTDWNGRVITGGTDAGVISLIIGQSVGGTGTVVPIGTMALSTHATDTVVDAALTATKFSTGDDVVIQRSLGTSTSNLTLEVMIQYQNTFQATDD